MTRLKARDTKKVRGMLRREACQAAFLLEVLLGEFEFELDSNWRMENAGSVWS